MKNKMPDIFISPKDRRKGDKNSITQPVVKSEEKFNKKDEDTLVDPPKGEERHKLPGHSHNPLSAYCFYPDGVKFINEDPEEKIILLLRRHPVTNLSWISWTFLMIIAPSFFPFFPPFELLPLRFEFIVTLVWYMITASFALEGFLKWFFQVNIVTDERIIEVDFLSLLYREMTDANIDQIQDVTPRVGGTLRTFFNYGDVVIQTAAAVPLITFEGVPNPDKVAKVLRELRIQEEVEKLEGRVR